VQCTCPGPVHAERRAEWADSARQQITPSGRRVGRRRRRGKILSRWAVGYLLLTDLTQPHTRDRMCSQPEARLTSGARIGERAWIQQIQRARTARSMRCARRGCRAGQWVGPGLYRVQDRNLRLWPSGSGSQRDRIGSNLVELPENWPIPSPARSMTCFRVNS